MTAIPGLIYIPDFMASTGIFKSADLFELLKIKIPWEQKVYPNGLKMPRLTAWMGSSDYAYSGLQNTPVPWISEIENG